MHAASTSPNPVPRLTEAPLHCLQYITEIDLRLGGVVRAVLDLSGSLAQAGHSVTLVTHDSRDCPNEWLQEAPGVPRVVTLGSLTKCFKRLSNQDEGEFQKLVDDANVLHLHTPWAPSNLQAAKLARESNKPYVVTIHGMLDDWCMSQRSTKKRLYMRLFGRRLLERASFVHCTAEGELKQSQPWFPLGQGVVLPLLCSTTNPVGTANEARKHFPVMEKCEWNLLFLGRLHEVKGIEQFIEATARLVQSGNDVQALLAGIGEKSYELQLRTLAERLGISDRIHFLGMVDGSLKWSLYRAADVFVLPSKHENFGLVSVEAMLCETPCVVSTNVNIHKELKQGGAVAVEPEENAIAEAIEQLLSNPGDLESRGQLGRDYILKWLAPNAVLSRLELLYATAIEEC